MKSLLLLIVVLITSCRSNVVNGPNLQSNTVYSGTFTVNQNWTGTVTLNFDQNSFIQDGTIKNVTTGKIEHIHNKGDLHIYADSVEFNKSLENSMAVFPNWMLIGKFAYSRNHGILNLSQSYSQQYSYVILLNKKP